MQYIALESSASATITHQAITESINMRVVWGDYNHTSNIPSIALFKKSDVILGSTLLETILISAHSFNPYIFSFSDYTAPSSSLHLHPTPLKPLPPPPLLQPIYFKHPPSQWTLDKASRSRLVSRITASTCLQ